ncbi:hypothetical protein [Spirosoma sordidisoli]|uniref:Uncharacterized protein n=1 Tax=Spirosoma sordidisoli TaxID=2502893 RepID=A0A4V1RWL9_9BACT|nr:hypothetical protein [Spirosoma sordidisoli]RYC70728.1 hypothetical protein EQG79_00820 [Spirosoma sordidisoli]
MEIVILLPEQLDELEELLRDNELTYESHAKFILQKAYFLYRREGKTHHDTMQVLRHKINEYYYG